MVPLTLEETSFCSVLNMLSLLYLFKMEGEDNNEGSLDKKMKKLKTLRFFLNRNLKWHPQLFQ